MQDWIKSLRLPMCLLAGLLTIMSFRMVHKDPPWLVVLAVVFIACSTMLQNDWRDRYHDVKKGKKLAITHPKAFMLFLLTFWLVSLSLTTANLFENVGFGVLLSLMGFVGLVYSEIRQVPMASVLLTSITSASPVLFPIVAGTGQGLELMFVSVVLVIFGREITKDLEDQKIDQNYKWTFPLFLGVRYSEWFVTASIGIGLIVALTISDSVLLGVLVSALGLFLMVKTKQIKRGRVWLDAGIAITILTITLMG